jgi:hypothetical protein
MNSNFFYVDQFLICSHVEQEIRKRDLSLLRIYEARLQLTVRLTEFNDLRRWVARRRHVPALLNARAGSSNRACRRLRDVRQRRVSI